MTRCGRSALLLWHIASPVVSVSPITICALASSSRFGSVTAASRISAISTPTSEKRATWGGGAPFTYAALANASSPSRQSLMRWEKRRSDLSTLLLQFGRSLRGVEKEKTNHLDTSDLSEKEVDTNPAVPLERARSADSPRPLPWNFSRRGAVGEEATAAAGAGVAAGGDAAGC